MLNERQRSRMRAALEYVMRAEDAVATVADEAAREGIAETDAALDRAGALLRELIDTVRPLAEGRR